MNQKEIVPKDYATCATEAPSNGDNVEASEHLAACMRATSSHAVEPAGRVHKRAGQGSGRLDSGLEGAKLIFQLQKEP